MNAYITIATGIVTALIMAALSTPDPSVDVVRGWILVL